MLSLKYSQMLAPCVYKVLDVKQHVLYVGFGSGGMGRVFDVSPDQKGRTKAFNKCDSVAVEFFPSIGSAEASEGALIHQLHPKHNAFCPRCNHYLKRRPKRFQNRGVLFGATRHRLLALLLTTPEKAYYLREIARLTGVSVGTTSRELKALVRIHVLKQVRTGHSVFFQAESASPFFNELRSMVAKGA